MHQHGRSVALLTAQLAMGYGSGGKDGIAVLRGAGGRAQADNQILNQPRKMSSTLHIAQGKMVKFTALFCSCQAGYKNFANTALQYRAHALLGQSWSRFALKQSLLDEVRELPKLERFHDDFVGLEKDR